MEKRFVKEIVFMEEAGNILACSMRSDGGERVKSSALYYLNAWNRLAAFVPDKLAWISFDYFESLLLLTEGVLTTRSNRMKFRLPDE